MLKRQLGFEWWFLSKFILSIIYLYQPNKGEIRLCCQLYPYINYLMTGIFNVIIGPETLFNLLSFMCLFVDFDKGDVE